MASGTTFLELSTTKFKQIPIPLAPVNEQKRIVLKLEELFSELDYSIENLEKIRGKLKIYRQAVLKESFINQSKGWQIKTLNDVCEKIQDGTHFSPKNQSDFKKDGYFMYLTSKNIRTNHLDLSSIKYIDEESHNKIYKRCNPEFGDVLLTKDGSNTGNVTVNSLKEPFSLLSSVCLLKPDKKVILAKYLTYFIQSPKGYKNIVGKMSGTAIKRIVLRQIRSAKISYPSLEIQKEIVQEIDSKFSLIDKVEEFLESNFNQIEILRHSILKKAFEGKLIEQDPNDEPATELIKRIKKEKELYLLEQKKAAKIKRTTMKRKRQKVSLSILEILEKRTEPISSKLLWEQSKHHDNIEQFYAALKKLEDRIEEKKKGKESLLSLKQ